MMRIAENGNIKIKKPKFLLVSPQRGKETMFNCIEKGKHSKMYIIEQG